MSTHLSGVPAAPDTSGLEEALRASEESYRTIFELSSDAIFVHDPVTGAVLDANHAACELHGCSLERLKELGVPGISDGSAPFTGEEARARIRAAAAGEPQRFEWLVRDAAGAPVWVEVALHAVSIRGEPRVLASARRIGDRKAAEDALKRLNDELEQRVEERTSELAQANLALEEEVADRSRAEEELLQRTSELEAVFRALPDLYFRLRPDGTLLDFRAGSQDPLFVPCDDCRGRPARDVFPPAVAAALEEGMREVARTGELVCVEDALALPGGGERHFEARVLPFDGGEVIAVVRDITDRAQAERALQRSEEHFRRLIENSSDVATILDARGVNVYQSPSVERVFGYRVEEMTGTPAFDRIHPDDAPRARQVLERVIRAPGVSQAVELRYRHRDGSWRWVEAVARTLAPDSAADGVIVNVRDVTERKGTERALQETTRFLESLVASSPGVIFRGSGDTFETTYISPNAETVLGFPAGRFLAEPHLWVERTHPDDREPVSAQIAAAVRNGERQLTYEYRFLHSDGTYHNLLASARFVRDPASAAVEVIGYTLDVSRLKEAEAALRAAKEEAEAAREVAESANRAKSEFLSRMSHELRTPMNSILGFAQLLARRDPTPDQQRAVDQILRAGGHLLNLINEVLDIARIEANRQPLSLEPVRVDVVVAEAVSLIRPLAAEHDCRVQEPDTAPGVHVCADRQRVVQVLLNLLSNAVKYNRPGGSVRVDVREVPPAEGGGGRGTVRVAVHDTGPGIAPERMAELFVPFARLGAEQSGVEGTGLGLALSRRLAEAMGGALTAESTPGAGSTFTLELPADSDPLERLASAPERGAAAEGAAAGREAKLLYIEDNLANLSLIETLLASRHEITLLTAMQGTMGLYLAWEQAPDLVLLDLHLPDLAGDEVLRRLRADPRTAATPVVVISADATPGRIERLLAAGADAYLTKPLDLDEFLETVDRLLAAKAAPGSAPDPA
jgi:PAS domain S-box-containing protein